MRRRRWLPLALLATVVGTLVVVAGMRSESVERTTITSDSMAPALAEGTTVAVQPLNGQQPARGDIVVFDDPGPWRAAARTSGRSAGPEDHLAKRVIAVGGDELWCCTADGDLVLDDEPLDEPYLADDVAPSTVAFRAQVPPGHLWLMGDNRAASIDSRDLRLSPGAAYVPVSAVRGTVEARPPTS